MGRWTQYDQDSERLPTGMRRIGYDADTRIYTFEDVNGALYESEPGNAYGILRPVAVLDYERDIRRVRPNAFESPKKSTSNHSRSSSTPSSTVRSFQDFLPPTAITSQPNTSNQSHDSPLPNVFSKIKSLTSIISRLQLSNKPPEGGRYHHIKSPSLPASSLSNFRHTPERRFPPSPHPQIIGTSRVPSKKTREYNLVRKEADEEEQELNKKRLFRSKTSVTRSKANALSSSALGSNSHSSSPSISSSNFEQFPPVPPKKNREYTSSRRELEENELRKGLLRSKTSVTKSSAVASSTSSAPGSKYHSSACHPPSPSSSSYHPKRTTSQAP